MYMRDLNLSIQICAKTCMMLCRKGVYLAVLSCARVLACLFPPLFTFQECPLSFRIHLLVLTFALLLHPLPPPCPLTNSPPPAPQRSRPPDAAGRCHRGGAAWEAWAPPRSRAADGPCPAFVHERNARNAGLHGGAQNTMTSL